MTEEERNEITSIVYQALDVFDLKKPEKPKNRFVELLRKKLSEQGTQRGLTLLLPILIVRYFKLDPQTAIDVVTGVLCIYGVHNVATEG
ncbi:MAG: hypothetical protein WBI40_06650 [Methylococcaceae bacterium]